MNIRQLKVGDRGDLLFHGSKEYGNSSYSLILTVEKIDGDIITMREDGASFGFDIYFSENRWRYGSSAEVITLTRKL